MSDNDGRQDFDFWMGEWKARNRRLVKRLAGSDEWVEFESTSVAWPLLDGLGNVDTLSTDWDGGFSGASFRLFNPDTQTWAIYWASTRQLGALEPPVIGSFSGDKGVFECEDTFEGRDIIVRYTWSRVATPTPRWEQAFSDDGGQTWETNWVADFERVTP